MYLGDGDNTKLAGFVSEHLSPSDSARVNRASQSVVMLESWRDASSNKHAH
jgi:hypothetical protein